MTYSIDIASELIPRQAKRLLSIALLLLCVLSTGTVVRIVQWYAAYKSQEIIRQILPLFHPVIPSGSAQTVEPPESGPQSDAQLDLGVLGLRKVNFTDGGVLW